MAHIGCIIMASGSSKRFGTNKLLTDFGGRPLIQYALDVAGSYPFTRSIVVTKHPEIARMCRDQGIEVLLHQKELRNEAIALGMAALSSTGSTIPDGCLFCLSDQPLLRSESVHALCSAFSDEPEFIYRLSYADTPGNPVLFPRAFFQALQELPDKAGGGYLVKKNPGQVRLVPARNAYELMDIDTPDDLSRLLLLWQKHI